jgi:transposase
LNQYSERLEWRRSKVLELSSQGHSQADISKIMQVSLGTVNKDIFVLRQRAKENIEKYVNERLPEEYEKCLVGLTAILKEAWHMSNQIDIENKEKVQALSLAKECYTTKMEMLTNVTVVDDAIKFVSRNSQHIQNGKGNKNKIIADDDGDIKKEVTDNRDTHDISIIEEDEEDIKKEVTNEIF